MRVYDEEGLVARAASMEAPLRAMLREMIADEPRCRGERVVGLLAALDFDGDAAYLKRLSAALRERRVHVHVKGERQLRGPGGALVLSPPLCITEDELRDGVERIRAAMKEAS